jgi:hypothetical protein
MACCSHRSGLLTEMGNGVTGLFPLFMSYEGDRSEIQSEV